MAAISAAILAVVLFSLLGLAGVFLALALVAAGVGVAASAFFGIELKRAMIIGAIFMAVHLGIGVLLRLAMS